MIWSKKGKFFHGITRLSFPTVTKVNKVSGGLVFRMASYLSWFWLADKNFKKLEATDDFMSTCITFTKERGNNLSKGLKSYNKQNKSGFSMICIPVVHVWKIGEIITDFFNWKNISISWHCESCIHNNPLRFWIIAFTLSLLKV